MIDLTEFDSAELDEMKNDPNMRALMMSDDDTGEGFPEPSIRDNLMKFFRDIIGMSGKKYDEISRTGNLKDGEIGYLGLPVRNYLSLANFSESEGWGTVAEYLRNKSNVMVNTSLSRKGALLNFVVTQKRVSKSVGVPIRESKRTLFGSTEKITGGDEE